MTGAQTSAVARVSVYPIVAAAVATATIWMSGLLAAPAGAEPFECPFQYSQWYDPCIGHSPNPDWWTGDNVPGEWGPHGYTPQIGDGS